MYDTMYRGDDYGGHNIPFPHPCPPVPHPFYDQKAFIDLGKYYGFAPSDGEDYYGYTMTPHGGAGWTADKAYRGDTLVRYLPLTSYDSRNYRDLRSYGPSEDYG